MAVRFVGDKLIDDDGEELIVSFETLLNACLKKEYKKLSIREIIFEGVEEATGQRVAWRNDFRKSALFNRIEAKILSDSNYQMCKKHAAERRAACTVAKTTVNLKSSTVEKAVRRNLRHQMRRRLY